MLKSKSNTTYVLVFLSLFIGYAVYSFLRKTLSSAYPGIRDELNITKSDYGYMVSQYALAYGCSKVLSGFLSDIISNRVLFCTGLVMTAMSNWAIAHCQSPALIGRPFMHTSLSIQRSYNACTIVQVHYGL